MNFYIKKRRDNTAEAWIEDWGKYDWELRCEAKLIIFGDKCLIDAITTDPKHRRKGYATALVKNLQERFSEVAPIGVVPTAQGFWDKFGMVDAMGEERDE